MENAIAVHGLTKHYKDFSLQDVSFTVPSGSIVGFIGENGAGKTTTIKAILGAIRADGGEITVLGQPVAHGCSPANTRVGAVLESNFFSPVFTAREISAVMSQLCRNWDDTLFHSYCSRFGLPENKPYKNFSKGMRVKLTIATALSHRPELLVLDEATSGLDPVVRSEILDLFQEFILEEEHSILLSSHITSDLEKVADYIVFIREGRIIFQLPRDELAERFAVAKCAVSQADGLAGAHVLGRRESRFDVELLVDNAPQVRRENPGLLMEPATIDDIMTFYVKGGK